jgi:hypothetical protein
MHWHSLPPGDNPGPHFRYRLSRPHSHIVNNSNDPIGGRIRDRPSVIAVHQPNAPTCTPVNIGKK